MNGNKLEITQELEQELLTREIKLMAVGDSITEGTEPLTSYVEHLWKILYTGGWCIDFVGSKQLNSPSSSGLFYEAYSGCPAETVAAKFIASINSNPADILLLHLGHNHFVRENPINGIIESYERVIAAARIANPRITVLVAQIIHSGKRNKYEYIPELNKHLLSLTARLDTGTSRVIPVDIASVFNWQTDACQDMVHPTPDGAKKIAACWADAIARVAPKAYAPFRANILKYKQTPTRDLFLHVFAPDDHDLKNKPAVVFFFGGGWVKGTALQFYHECRRFAKEGFVAFSAEYRTQASDGATVFESDEDGRSAIRWIRAHAAELGVDPDKIAAAGSSAGGQIAAECAFVSGPDSPNDDASISAKPNALVLNYPVVDNSPEGFCPEYLREKYQRISPLHNIGTKSGSIPCIFFLGTNDPLIPVSTAVKFKNKVDESEGSCELILFKDKGHPIYRFRAYMPKERDVILNSSLRFLKERFFRD